MQQLIDVLLGRDGAVGLDRAALWLATIEHPGLEFSPYLELLDSHAAELGARLHSCNDGVEFVAVANDYLFEELGFAGNAGHYYDPDNSCLNQVLVSRTGIPITLSLVYMEIARRLGRPVFGIGLPGHFIVKYDDGVFSAFIDPFHKGAFLSQTECFDLASEALGRDVTPDPRILGPMSQRHILMRMCYNMRGVYFQRREYPKALQVLDILLAADPRSADDHRHRGLLHLQMKNMRAAKDDLEAYLRLSPAAEDYGPISRQVIAINQFLAGLN